MEYIDNFAFSQNSGVKIQSPVQVLFIPPPPRHPAFFQAIVWKLIIAPDPAQRLRTIGAALHWEAGVCKGWRGGWGEGRLGVVCVTMRTSCHFPCSEYNKLRADSSSADIFGLKMGAEKDLTNVFKNYSF